MPCMFHQGAIHRCTECNGPYNPDTHQQRYCRTCGHWFHNDCLQSLPRECQRPLELVKEHIIRGGLSIEDKYEKMLCIPICRGKRNGIVGNERVIMNLWGEVEKAEKLNGRDINMAFISHLTSDLLQQAKWAGMGRNATCN